MGRSLGMTLDEFWGATLAQVTELYRVQILSWARTRDYFVAELCALTLNRSRHESSDRVWRGDDFLSGKYPSPKSESVIITPAVDPDRGAAGDWQGLRQALKNRTPRKRKT